VVAILRTSSQPWVPLRKGKVLVGHYRNTWGQNSMRLLRGKEDPMKLQTRLKAGRPNRTTTPSFVDPLGTHRSREVRSCPDGFKRPNTKENCMKFKTKMKAGKLSSNHNPIVR
jgi:hypothetical protein